MGLFGAILWPFGSFRYGEARNPGPQMKVVHFNATSLEPLLPWFFGTNYDVAIISEARIPVDRETSVSGAFRRAGWSAVFHSGSSESLPCPAKDGPGPACLSLVPCGC